MQLESHPNIENSNQTFSFFGQRPRLLLMISVLIFILALGLRIYGFYSLDAPGTIAERQFRSALIARAYYFEMTNAIPEWRMQIAETSKQRAGVLEPPIMELMVASIYRLVNGEYLWIARLLSSIFWVVGGIFLYKIAKRMMPVEAALFATAYYLFIPLGVVASISFLPDPLMIMMFLLSLLTIVWYNEQPSKLRLVMAAIVSGLAVLVKPFIMFAVLGAFIALAIHKRTSWKRVIDFDVLIFLGICLAISALYYLYGMFIAKSMSSNFQAGFLPYLYFQPNFWKSWLLTAIAAVGFVPFIAALLGLPMLRQGWARALVIGLGIGYIVFGLVYTFPIGISSHYHLQLIVIVALSFGPIIALIINYLRRLPNQWYWWLPVAGALLLVMLFNIRDVRGDLASHKQFENEEIAQEVGEIVDHSDQVVYVATYYGMPLEYYGELSGTYWPRRIVNWDWVKDRLHGVVDQSGTYGASRITNWIFRRLDVRELSIEERLDALDISPEYFVITDLDDFDRNHTDLEEFLANNCSLVAESDQYLIYEACRD
jgi:4-amino-4-deoxy-L-arabinose transferase-like glycosyltransferase